MFYFLLMLPPVNSFSYLILVGSPRPTDFGASWKQRQLNKSWPLMPAPVPMKTEWLQRENCPESIWPFPPSAIPSTCFSAPAYHQFPRYAFGLPALPQICPPFIL